MSPVMPNETIDDNRRQIIDAAEERYRNYGYGKTTMAEIADDVGMSAANLYRYFKNKHEIGAACAQRCMSNLIDELLIIVRAPNLSAEIKLRKYVLGNLAYSYENSGVDQKINELVQIIVNEDKDLVYKQVEREIGLIAEILAQGNSSKEFAIDDVLVTARSIQSATLMFNVPVFMGLYPIEQFQEMANGVVDLILSGISTR